MTPRPHEASAEHPTERLLRRGSDAILFTLVIFTPLAYGSVEPWAVAIIEWSAMLAFWLWLAGRLSPRAAYAPGAGGSWRRLHPLLPTLLMSVAVIFIAWVLLQLVPLPSSLMKVASPAAHRLYQRTLPNYGKANGVDFNRLEGWLLEGSAAASVEEALPAWATDRPSDLAFSSWRPLSLAPASTRRNLGILLAYLLLFLVASDRARERTFRRRLLWAMACTGVLVAMLGLAQETTWGDRLYGRIRPAYGGTPMGPFVNRNHFAGYLEMTLSVFTGLWLALLRRERSAAANRSAARSAPTDDQRYVPQLFMVTLFLAAGMLAIWKSGSRGGMVAVGACALVLGMSAVARLGAGSGWRRLVATACIALLVAGISWKVRELTRQESMEPDLATEPSFGKRLYVWKTSLGMLREFPVTGTGFGTYGYSILPYQGGGYNRLWIYAHNDYVQLACETGLVGLALFGVGFAWFWKRALWPVLADPLGRGGAVLGCAAGVICLLVHSLVDFNLQIPSNGLLFVLLGAILVSSTPIAPSGSADPAPVDWLRRGRKSVLVLAAVVLLASALVVAISVAARHWQSTATAAFWRGNVEKAARDLERARHAVATIPDVQADVGFFYLRILQGWEQRGAEVGVPRGEAVRRARIAFCRAINMNPINTNPWSGLAELYVEAAVGQLQAQPLDLSEILAAPERVPVLDRLYLAVTRKMMALEPRNPYYQARLGDFLWERENRPAALRAYEEAVRLLPKVEEHPFLSGQGTDPDILQAAIRGARRALSEGVVDMPEHRVRFYLSSLYSVAGDVPAATEHMERACSLQPENRHYQYRLGALAYHAGDLGRSRELLLQSIKLGLRNELPYQMLARVAAKRGDAKEASEYYRKALGMNPENGRVALEAAKHYELLGEMRMAERYYERAVELLPGDVNALLSAAEYYADRGATGRAIAILKKVVALRPHEPVYRKRLEQLRERAGYVE